MFCYTTYTAPQLFPPRKDAPRQRVTALLFATDKTTLVRSVQGIVLRAPEHYYLTHTTISKVVAGGMDNRYFVPTAPSPSSTARPNGNQDDEALHT